MRRAVSPKNLHLEQHFLRCDFGWHRPDQARKSIAVVATLTRTCPPQQSLPLPLQQPTPLDFLHLLARNSLAHLDLHASPHN